MAVSGIELPGLHLTLSEIENHTAKYDLTLIVWEDGDSLLGAWEYDTDLFSPSTIERMAGQFELLLEAMIADPARTLAELPMGSVEENEQLISDFTADLEVD